MNNMLVEVALLMVTLKLGPNSDYCMHLALDVELAWPEAVLRTDTFYMWMG